MSYGENLHEMSKFFSGENKKKEIEILSPEIFTQHAKVKFSET